MDTRSTVHGALESAIARLLRPLFRVLLRHSMSFVAFEALAKRVYVEVAMKDFGIEGKKPTISRASILSGLTRKEVHHLLSEAARWRARRGRAIQPRGARAHRLGARQRFQ